MLRLLIFQRQENWQRRRPHSRCHVGVVVLSGAQGVCVRVCFLCAWVAMYCNAYPGSALAHTEPISPVPTQRMYRPCAAPVFGVRARCRGAYAGDPVAGHAPKPTAARNRQTGMDVVPVLSKHGWQLWGG